MSNKDSNGYERAWALEVLSYADGRLRHRIIPNPDHKAVKDISHSYALADCAKDAVLHMVADAQNALELHLKDLHKWP